MQNLSYLIVAYAVVWLALLGYIGWVALRMHGVQTEVETVREMVHEREREAAAQPRRD